MDDRIGRYVCLVMSTEGKLDLFRDGDESVGTPLFDSIEEAQVFLRDHQVESFTIVKIEKDTF